MERPLGKSRNKWENNIKTDVREIWYDDVDWIRVAEDGNR